MIFVFHSLTQSLRRYFGASDCSVFVAHQVADDRDRQGNAVLFWWDGEWGLFLRREQLNRVRRGLGPRLGCAACGQPIVQSPSHSERWPLFQYGLIAFAVPFSLSGVSMALRMQGIGVSDDVMGLGIVFGALTAVCLFVAASVDRTYLNRGKPAGSVKVVSRFTVIVFLLAIIWLLLAIVAEQAGFKLE